MAGIDVNRTSTGVLALPSEVSREVWQNVQAASVVQSLSRKIDLPAGGIDIPIITSDPEAEWVTETDEKPVSRPAFGSKTIRGHKMAVIVPFSNEFRRDHDALYQAIVQKLPGVLAKKFDRTALGFQSSPGTGFDTLAAAPSVELDGTYDKWLDALELVGASGDDADITAWALSKGGEIDAMRTKDGDGNPLLIRDAATQGSIGSILARPVFKSANAGELSTNVVGIAGDWESTVWGAVEDITLRISDQATINDGGTQINLWQRNMFAVLAEFEVGFAARDPKRFAKITRKAVADPENP